MITLQQYMNENLDEGKIWDSIKDWFKKLFEPSNKEFDRYGNEENLIEGSNLVRFKKYLEDNYDENSIRIEKIPFNKLDNIIRPNGTEPNEEENFGFYKFAGKLNEKDIYFGLIYEDSKVKDTASLIKIKQDEDENIIELLELQVIQEFTKYLPIRVVTKLLENSNEFIGANKVIIVKEKTNKELYNQVINDCGFEKVYENDENIAKLEIKEK